MRTQSLIVSLFLCLLTLLIFSTRASAQSAWTFCASEGGTCSFSGTQQVRYGANGAYVYKTLTGSTACTNAVFGDPAYGVLKQCEYAASTNWTFCASENGYCSFSGTQQVRYGANGSYVYKTLTGGTACTNAVFGDPAYGVAKGCDYAASTITDWTFCAERGRHVPFQRHATGALWGERVVCLLNIYRRHRVLERRVRRSGSWPWRNNAPLVGTSTSSVAPPSAAFRAFGPRRRDGYGPQAAITCPAGAVDIFPGQYIQGIVNLYAGRRRSVCEPACIR
jgi:hypothetical protein